MSNLSYCQSKHQLMIKLSLKQNLKIDWPVEFPNILTKYFQNQLQYLQSIEPTKLALIYIYGTDEDIKQSLKHNFICDSEGLVEMYRVKRWPFVTLPPTISNLIKHQKWKSVFPPHPGLEPARQRVSTPFLFSMSFHQATIEAHLFQLVDGDRKAYRLHCVLY